MATFSVIIPTCGRRFAARTLNSLVGQLEPGDEILVLRDDTGDSGDTPRNDGMSRARGSHLVFIDDDDAYVRGAFAKMRRFADQHPGRIGIFKLEYVAGNSRWVDPVLRYKNVSTQMFVIPNVPGRLGRWGRRDRVAGDFVFIDETVRLQGDPVFVDEVTVLIRPERNRLKRAFVRARYRARLRTRLKQRGWWPADREPG
jgi:glycosyltransferase involved in cell wall biosynthesis